MKKHTAKKRVRKASTAEQRKLGLPKDCTVEEVDLHDPNLAPEHRDNFITGVRSEVVRLDEIIGSWYRHRGECGDPECDCGGNDLAERVENLCGHLLACKELFGVIIIDDYSHFRRFVKDFGGDAYARLTATERAQWT
jgi:hypothetical protein